MDTVNAGNWRKDGGHGHDGHKVTATLRGKKPMKRSEDDQEPFSEFGPPGSLGRELLTRFAGVTTEKARPVTLAEMFDDLRPRWAVAALARIEAAGWVESAGTKNYAVTALGWEVMGRKRKAA